MSETKNAAALGSRANMLNNVVTEQPSSAKSGIELTEINRSSNDILESDQTAENNSQCCTVCDSVKEDDCYFLFLLCRYVCKPIGECCDACCDVFVDGVETCCDGEGRCGGDCCGGDCDAGCCFGNCCDGDNGGESNSYDGRPEYGSVDGVRSFGSDYGDGYYAGGDYGGVDYGGRDNEGADYGTGDNGGGVYQDGKYGGDFESGYVGRYCGVVVYDGGDSGGGGYGGGDSGGGGYGGGDSGGGGYGGGDSGGGGYGGEDSGGGGYSGGDSGGGGYGGGDSGGGDYGGGDYGGCSYD